MKFSIMSNAAWMMSEKVVSVFGVIFVTSYVAKSFGPSVFGQMAFSTSLFSVVQTIAIFGTETLLFKHVSRNVQKGKRLMAIARQLRLALLLLVSVPVLLYVWLAMAEDFRVFTLAAFWAALFFTQDIFSVYNNARLASRLNTLANSLGMLASFAISFSVAWWQLSPVFLAFSIIVVSLIPFMIKRYLFFKAQVLSSPPLAKRKRYLRYLLCAGLPLAISSILISVQVKTAQFFLVGVSSAKELGLFAAANTLSASWIFIPMAIITSCFTEIFRERADVAVRLTARLYGYVMAVSLLMLIVVSLVGERLIMALYGADYARSGTLLILLALATSCSAMGTVAYRFMVKEGGYHYLLKKIACLLCISIPLSWVLIHWLGLRGAAWSVFLTELLSLTVMNYFFKHGVIFDIQRSSLNYKTYK